MFGRKLKEREYRKFTRKGDPRFSGTLPPEVLEDLKKMAKTNGRSLKDEIVARLVATLDLNKEYMMQDRIRRLIYSRNLRVDPNKKGKK